MGFLDFLTWDPEPSGLWPAYKPNVFVLAAGSAALHALRAAEGQVGVDGLLSANVYIDHLEPIMAFDAYLKKLMSGPAAALAHKCASSATDAVRLATETVKLAPLQTLGSEAMVQACVSTAAQAHAFAQSLAVPMMDLKQIFETAFGPDCLEATLVRKICAQIHEHRKDLSFRPIVASCDPVSAPSVVEALQRTKACTAMVITSADPLAVQTLISACALPFFTDLLGLSHINATAVGPGSSGGTRSVNVPGGSRSEQGLVSAEWPKLPSPDSVRDRVAAVWARSDV
jgi:hypothetical protein